MTNPALIDVSEVDPLDSIVDGILGEEPEEQPEEIEAANAPEVDDESEAESEHEDAEEEPEYLEIKHNGKPVKLSLDEVVEHAQKGFDYTTKTQELAEQRRQVEQYAQYVQQQAVYQQQFSKEMAELTAMDMQLERYKQVDWSGYTDQDPVEATKAWQKFQMLQGQRMQLSQEMAQRQAQMQHETARMNEMRLSEAADQLARELGKEWNDSTRKALKDVGTEYGFSAEELDGIQDPRAVKVLYDAMKWRQLQANKPAMQKKVSEAPKLAKPGAKAQNPVDVKAKQLSKILKTSKSRKDRESAAMGLLDKFIS